MRGTQKQSLHSSFKKQSLLIFDFICTHTHRTMMAASATAIDTKWCFSLTLSKWIMLFFHHSTHHVKSHKKDWWNSFYRALQNVNLVIWERHKTLLNQIRCCGTDCDSMTVLRCMSILLFSQHCALDVFLFLVPMMRRIQLFSYTYSIVEHQF